MIDEWGHVIDQWSHVILCAMAAMLLKDYNFKLHTINLAVYFFFPPTILVASGNCVVVLLHPPVSQVLLWWHKVDHSFNQCTTKLHPPAPVGYDMERGGCGLCMSGCGQLLGLANLTNGTCSLNYNFCV